MSISREMSIFDLPKEMLFEVADKAGDQIEMRVLLAHLSQTSKAINKQVQPDLDKPQAQKLLSFVVLGKTGKAKQIYSITPRLLFLESKAEEYAAGFDEAGNRVHRVVHGTPLQAMAATGLVWMIEKLIKKDEFSKYYDAESGKTGFELAIEQLNLQFPEGFNYPKSTYDFKKIIKAINLDEQLFGTGVPSEETKKIVAQFKKDFMPDVVDTGHYFNLTELAEADRLLFKKYKSWNDKQLTFFFVEVLGYLERLVTIFDAYAAVKGVEMAQVATPATGYDLKFNENRSGVYFPLDLPLQSQLGTHEALITAKAFYGYLRKDPENSLNTNADFLIKVKETRLNALMAELIKLNDTLGKELKAAKQKEMEAAKKNKTEIVAKKVIEPLKPSDIEAIKKIQALEYAIQEHAKCRVDMFFNLLVAVYEKKITFESDMIAAQGANDAATLSMWKMLCRFVLQKMNIDEDSIIINFTDQLPQLVQHLDRKLELLFNNKYLINTCLGILNKTSRSEMDPRQGLNEFLKLMDRVCTLFEKNEKNTGVMQKIVEYQKVGIFAAANNERQVPDQYLSTMFRIPPQGWSTGFFSSPSLSDSTLHFHYKKVQDQIFKAAAVRPESNKPD